MQITKPGIAYPAPSDCGADPHRKEPADDEEDDEEVDDEDQVGHHRPSMAQRFPKLTPEQKTIHLKKAAFLSANIAVEEFTTDNQANLEKVKKQWKEQYKVNIKENGTWLSQLQSFVFPGNNPDYFINYEKYVDALTTKDIQDAAKLLLTTKNVVTGILRPEKTD